MLPWMRRIHPFPTDWVIGECLDGALAGSCLLAQSLPLLSSHVPSGTYIARHCTPEETYAALFSALCSITRQPHDVQEAWLRSYARNLFVTGSVVSLPRMGEGG